MGLELSLAERGPDMAEAAGSYPARRTINAPVAQWQSNRLISDRCWFDSRLVHHRNGDSHDHIAQIGRGLPPPFVVGRMRSIASPDRLGTGLLSLLQEVRALSH